MAGLLVTMVALYITNSVQMAMVYGALTGITMAFQIIVSGVIWPDYYGRRNLGSIRGVTMMAGVIGSALGPLPYGYAYDIFGGYTEVLTASMNASRCQHSPVPGRCRGHCSIGARQQRRLGWGMTEIGGVR